MENETAAGPMRSPRAIAGALILLLGVPLAAFVAIAFGDGAEPVIHMTLGASFLLMASAVFDFRLPAWFNLAACAATATLAGVFLLQGASDLTHGEALRHLAFDVLGQRLEKLLGYAFLLWCFGVLWRDCWGGTRIFGAAFLAVILGVEGYCFAMASVGREAPGILKLLHVPLFFWLLLEGMKRRHGEIAGSSARYP